MISRIDGVTAAVSLVAGSTFALAKARPKLPAAVSTAPHGRFTWRWRVSTSARRSSTTATPAPAACRLEEMVAPLIAHYPSDSDLGVVKDFSARVMARNPDTEVHIYQGTKKRFDVEDGLAFDPSAARLAHRRTVDFLNRRL